MKAPVSFQELQTLSSLLDFNQVHDTSLSSWSYYFREIGMTGYEASVDRQEEYRRYLLWWELHNSPLMKALR